jgi:hypothetical protein
MPNSLVARDNASLRGQKYFSKRDAKDGRGLLTGQRKPPGFDLAGGLFERNKLPGKK